MSELTKTSLPTLPAALTARANGELEGQTILAWAEFDLDLGNQFHQQFVVLTETDVVVMASEQTRSIPIAELTEARIVEGLGVDSLNLIVGAKLAVEMRYTRRQRRDMTRMHRKIERVRPRKASENEIPPDWLDVVERREEEKSHCPKCGEVIPSYAEGVCPRCLHKRKILWRLLDVAKPYRRRVRMALALTIFVSATASL